MFNPRKTVVRCVSPEHPDAQVIDEAAEVLRRGGLVAFPTETVYGLGANALDPNAVEQIFAAKGRPANNPIIVHIVDATAARKLVAQWPESATRLANRFWPGPLTLVLTRRPEVPEIVTAGGATLGLRVPGHAVAQALLRAAKLPIAAPSANRSTQISPTTAAHALRGLEGRVDMILDGGPTCGGLESTVLDLTALVPRVLRPGLVTVEQLRQTVGEVEIHQSCQSQAKNDPLRSPGMLERHYAPRATLICVDREVESTIAELLARGCSVGCLRLNAAPLGESREPRRVKVVDMPFNSAAYSARLYAALHELDDANVDYIVVDLPPAGDEWMAVHDRLRRAANRD